MQVLKIIFRKIRHNILVYMFVDVPQQESKGSIKKAVTYTLAILGLMGLYGVNKIYHYGNLPPEYESLNVSEGTLLNISTNLGRRGGIRIRIEDVDGNIARFPNDSDSLPYTKYKAKRIKKECVGKPVTVKWFEEEKLFFGKYVGAWEIIVCEEFLNLEFSKTQRLRKLSIKFYKNLTIIFLMCSLASLAYFVGNFNKAKALIKDINE